MLDGALAHKAKRPSIPSASPIPTNPSGPLPAPRPNAAVVPPWPRRPAEKPRRLLRCWRGSGVRRATGPPPPGCHALDVPPCSSPESLCGRVQHLPIRAAYHRGAGRRSGEAGRTRVGAMGGGEAGFARWTVAARAAGGATGAAGARWCNRLSVRRAAEATSVRRATHRLMAQCPTRSVKPRDNGRPHGAPRAPPLVGSGVACPIRAWLFLC